MQVVKTPGSARAIARTLPRPVGFVPTMGALHAGHRSLIERAVRENRSVVASLFVNPLQFGPNEDFARYPRDFARDAAMLEECGVTLLYAPSVERMYPPGFALAIDVGPAARGFEGAARPGHFNGVATVVAKLLHAVEPTTLYLGQKDAQQTVVLRTLVRDLDLPVCVVVCATVREPDGLALSSRNVYLTPRERAAAPSLHRALERTARAVAGGERDPARARALGAAALEAPLVLEYLDLVDPATFAPLDEGMPPAIVVAAARAGTTRLIDNVAVAAPDGLDPLVSPPARIYQRR